MWRGGGGGGGRAGGGGGGGGAEEGGEGRRDKMGRTLTNPNSKHCFTAFFHQPLPYLVTP